MGQKQNKFAAQFDEDALYGEYLAFVEQGRTLWTRFTLAGVSVPKRLQAFIGTENAPERESVQISRMKPPVAVPSRMGEDWIWVPAGHSSTQVRSVVLAILRQENKPVPAKVLVEKASAFREINEGSIANIGTALEREHTIERHASGWMIVQYEKAPLIEAGYLWGPPSAFSKPEVAWFRRAAIKHLLRVMGDGLQIMQIVGHLRRFDWLPGPREKDTIKVDMEVLAKDGEVKRTSARKWLLTEKEVAP